MYGIEGEELGGSGHALHADFGALALFPASRRDTIALERRNTDDQALGGLQYDGSPAGAGPGADAVCGRHPPYGRRCRNDVEWIVGDGEVEPPGSISMSE